MKRIEIILCILFVSFISCEKYAEPEIFLIPNNYEGVILVVFQQEDGSEKLYKNEKRIYKIPDNGILYTKFSRPEGILSQEFYYKNNQNNKLNSILLQKEPKNNLTYILDQYGGQSSLLPKSGISNGSINNYDYLNWMYFIIGTPLSDKNLLRGKANCLIKKVVDNYPKKIE